MIHETKSKLVTLIFDSLTDQIETVGAIKPEVHGGLDRPWIGRTFKTWDDVFEALQSRWDEGMIEYEKMLFELRDQHIEPPKSLKRRLRWSEEDGEVDIDRLFSKQDRIMRDTFREHRPGPVSVTLVCNISEHAGVDSINMLWKAAAAVYLTELLEQSGYRVELWGCCIAGGMFVKPWADGLIGVCYKRGSDLIDPSTLINSLSGWSLRTIFFGSMYFGDLDPDVGYGIPLRLKFNMDKLKELGPDEQSIICEGILSRQAAIEWIKNQVALLK